MIQQTKLPVSYLFLSRDSSEFNTNSIRICSLSVTLSLIEKVVLLYENLQCLPEIIGPLRNVLSKIPAKSLPPQVSRTAVIPFPGSLRARVGEFYVFSGQF